MGRRWRFSLRRQSVLSSLRGSEGRSFVLLLLVPLVISLVPVLPSLPGLLLGLPFRLRCFAVGQVSPSFLGFAFQLFAFALDLLAATLIHEIAPFEPGLQGW